MNAQPQTMHDKNGQELKVGDSITSQQGNGTIIAYLDFDVRGMGALVRIEDKLGHKVDLRLKLAQAVYVPRVDPQERITTSKYGV